jgi:hypothetical protein
MSKKEKLEEDYKKYNNEIESLVEEEITRIRERINSIKMQAEKVGEKAEISLEKSSAKEAEKKG